MKYIINNNNVIKLRQTYRKVLCFIYFPFLPFLYFVSVLLVFLYFFCISFFLQHLVFMKMLYFGNGKGLARQIIHFVFFLILFLVFAFVSDRDKLGNFIVMLSQIYWEREIHVKKSFLPTDLIFKILCSKCILKNSRKSLKIYQTHDFLRRSF